MSHWLNKPSCPWSWFSALAVCVLACGQSLSLPFCALGLMAFLIAAQVFSPLDLGNSPDARRTRKILPRILFEWSCVVAVLVFLSTSFKLTYFPRDIMVSWFLVTPVALMLADSLRIPIAKWLTSDRGLAQRYIIIGANDVGVELARRIEHSHAGEKFFGFLDFRGADRAAHGLNQTVIGNCSARDFADFVRTHAISRVYLALPISTAPRIEELLRELRDTTASIYFVPNLFAFDLVQARCVQINGMPAFSICESPLQGMSGFWKRVFDVVLASIALVFAVARGDRGGAGDQAFIAGTHTVQATPLRPERRGNIDIQIPQHDGVRGWPRRGSSHREGLSRHSARRILAAHLVGRITADLERARGQDEFRGPEAACGGSQRRVPKTDQWLHDSPQGASRHHGLGAGQRPARRNFDDQQDASSRPVRPRLPQELVVVAGFEDTCENGTDGRE